MAILNLLDVAAAKNTDKVVGLIEESISYAPELQVFPARSVRGTSFYTFKRTGLPTVGFRKANAGVVPSKSTFVRGLAECFILSSQIQVDKAVAQAFEDGSAALEMIEAAGVMQAAMRTIGKQIFYGTDNEADGFTGLKAFLPKAGAMTYDVTGTTATSQSSVYFVKFGEQFCQLVLGNNADFNLGAFRDESFLDANDSTKMIPGRVADLTAWTGLAINNANCAVRLANVSADADTGKTLTDSFLQRGLDLFPTGIVPDAIFMSRRSRSQLQRARTVTLMGNGKTRPDQPNIAPPPTDYVGIPIVATDSILNTDAVE
jgi:hypothetical protein